MKCKNHPDHDATKICSSCNIPICDDCAEEVSSEKFFCFNCAMLQAVSVVGTSMADKKAKVHEKDRDKKKKELGPFHYFVIAACVLISVMWVVIIFGGEKAPGKKMDYAKQERVFLFMVGTSLKRYHNYEKKRYPEKLSDLVPKYLSMATEDLHYLEMLSYKKEKNTGYTLSFTSPKPGSLSIIISPQGIKYEVVAPKEDE